MDLYFVAVAAVQNTDTGSEAFWNFRTSRYERSTAAQIAADASISLPVAELRVPSWDHYWLVSIGTLEQMKPLRESWRDMTKGRQLFAGESGWLSTYAPLAKWKKELPMTRPASDASGVECFPHCPAGAYDAGSLAPLGRWAVGATPDGDAAGVASDTVVADIKRNWLTLGKYVWTHMWELGPEKVAAFNADFGAYTAWITANPTPPWDASAALTHEASARKWGGFLGIAYVGQGATAAPEQQQAGFSTGGATILWAAVLVGAYVALYK